MERYLIVNADDYGLTRDVSKGILEAHQNGIVSSTTVMINLPGAREDIKLLKEEAPHLGVGLHVNFGLGQAVSDRSKVQSITNSKGEFLPADEIFAADIADVQSELAAEVNAQIALFKELFAQDPDHIDSHQFFAYLHPSPLAAILDYCTKESIPLRSISNDSLERIRKFIRFDECENSSLLWDRIKSTICRLVSQYPDLISTTNLELGFFEETANYQVLDDIIRNLPAGSTELMCHPGLGGSTGTGYNKQRISELAVLSDPRLPKLLETEGVKLITFAELQQFH